MLNYWMILKVFGVLYHTDPKQPLDFKFFVYLRLYNSSGIMFCFTGSTTWGIKATGFYIKMSKWTAPNSSHTAGISDSAAQGSV